MSALTTKKQDSRKSRLIVDLALDLVKIDFCCEVVSSVLDKKAAFMKSQQYSWLNKTCIMIPVGMPTEKGKISQDPTPR